MGLHCSYFVVHWRSGGRGRRPFLLRLAMQQGCVCGSQGSRGAVFVARADGVWTTACVLRFYVPSGALEALQ